MILKKKKLLIITSLLTLLPIPIGLLLWNQFPETMAIHFGFNGLADGYGSPSFVVFVLPLIMLAFQWVCVLATSLDKDNKNRNHKMQSLVLWIIPLIGNLSIFGIYALALGWEFSPVAWTLIPMGILFALIGNYLPKTRMNSTMGIKVWWAYTSEENWNATHRFGGKVWMIGGILMALCGLLPHLWAITVMLVGILVLVVLPILYSWRYYKKELAEGKALKKPGSAMSKKAKLFSGMVLALLTVFLGVILFCGNIEYSFHDAYQDTYLLIDANLYTDYILYYDTIDHLEFREGNVPGLRIGGYGSFRLLMGWFENEEFGTYLRYTYYNPEACVVVTSGDKKIVLSDETYAATKALYEKLLVLTQS